jgi:hypothetical protein
MNTVVIVVKTHHGGEGRCRAEMSLSLHLQLPVKLAGHSCARHVSF